MIHRDKDPTLKAYLAQLGLKALGFDLDPDNWWGPKTEAAYQEFLESKTPEWNDGVASVFADMKDLAVFAKMKAKGMSDREAFRYGDNGIGASGKITAQTEKPMVALHPLDIRAKYGEMSKAWGKQVEVEYNGQTCLATLEDYMSSPHASIDLNPACVAQLGFDEGLGKVKWRWA